MPDPRFISRPIAVPWERMLPCKLLMAGNVTSPPHLVGNYIASQIGSVAAGYSLFVLMGTN